ncbi:unnamed protein product [Mytilus coruscus]|uniref:Uncharacterized protein n=1 Tax=Mytilus coruscus TaxID=42192 RepID=A0A6J8DDW4_MYTCO|nr:unnamed protein product [Mytilus coruscus]
MNVQRLILAQTQLAEELSQKNSTCLLNDETSKYETKSEGYHVSDNEGRLWVLGLRNILTKGAKDTLKTFQEILQDISEVSEESRGNRARIKKLEGYTSAILDWGLWQTDAQVDLHIGTISKCNKDKIEALKAQLNFRRHVLIQKPKEKDVFNFTKVIGTFKRRVNLTVEELTCNVKKLVEHAFTITSSTVDNQEEGDVPFLVGKAIKMHFEGTDGSVQTSRTGHVISTVHTISIQVFRDQY